MYLKTSSSPYKYYIDSIRNSLLTIIGDEESCDYVFMQNLETYRKKDQDLPSAQVDPNHPVRLVRYAFYAIMNSIQAALLTTLKDNNGKGLKNPGFAAEFYSRDLSRAYSPDDTKSYYVNKKTGYYIYLQNMIWDTIQDEHDIKMLLGHSKTSIYTVIDTQQLYRSIKNALQTYYAKNPEYATSCNPNKEVQRILGDVVAKFMQELSTAYQDKKEFNI